MGSLPENIWRMQEHIREVAKDYGLDFFETIFEMVDYKKINELAAYGGFPTRYPHWRFGMEYEQLSKSSEYGLSKIYEMVINNDPSYAYLLEGNNLTDQKTVIAHVYAHVDFFKNNTYFSKTNRRMVDEMANHAALVRRYIDRWGIEAVEDFIDTCLSVDNLIDPYSPFIEPKRHDEEPEPEPEVPKFKAKGYMESYINPDEYLEAQRQKMAQEAAKEKHFPRRPERDVMKFLLDHAPLEGWEADLLTIVREEAYYFIPQGQTKVMNEGWACVAPETLVFTGQGVMTMQALVRDQAATSVSDGTHEQDVYGAHAIERHETVGLRTALGLTLTGSTNHRIHDDGACWKRLDQFSPGDKLRVSGGAGVWASTPVPFEWGGQRQVYGVSGSMALAPASQPRWQGLARPEVLDESCAALLGWTMSRGLVREQTRLIWRTTAYGASALATLGQKLFCLTPEVVQVDKSTWDVMFDSAALADLSANHPQWSPAAGMGADLLRSPRAVVVCALQAWFDADAQVGEEGISLQSTCPERLEHAQLLLLNLGVLCAQDGQELRVTGQAAATFARAVGFRDEHKSRALLAYIQSEAGRMPVAWTDEVVQVERGQGPVLDISVAHTHRYAAAGMIHHNSFWHERILTGGVLDSSEIIDYADINSRVLATTPGQFNPYKLGVELYLDIEHRWNTGKFGREWEDETSMAARAQWNKNLGLGMEKIFEVRALHNDVTFIDEFLTEEFARRNKMFSYIFNKKSSQWEIESREFGTIKDRLLAQLINFGQPYIYVRDGNFKNRRELLLHHKFQGTELRTDYAKGVLEALHKLWKRPVSLETKFDEKGVLLRFDGKEHSERAVEYVPI